MPPTPAPPSMRSVRLDDDMQALLDAFRSLAPERIEEVDVSRARASPTLADAVLLRLAHQHRSADPKDLEPTVDSRLVTVDGAAGPLPARVYVPIRAAGPLPALLYLPGGGWVLGGKDAYDGSARSLCAKTQALVVSVDYRRAPEDPFPAAWDDALAAWQWLHREAPSLGVDRARLALAGESAGGTLALATAIAARDRQLPVPVHVLSVYPLAAAADDIATPAADTARPGDLPLMNRAMLRWFMGHLVRGRQDLSDPRLNLVAAEWAGLPPVSVVTAAHDPLHEHGVVLQSLLQRAGVPVERRHFDGVTHGFFGAAPVLQKAREAQAWAAQRLRGSFALRAAPMR